ncbi:hypothetical protein ACFPYM_04690, partial [Methylobacterium hispanicum]
MSSPYILFRSSIAMAVLACSLGSAVAGGLTRVAPPDPRVRTEDGYMANYRSCIDGTGCDRQLLSITDEGFVRGAEYEGNRRACETGNTAACRPGLLDRDDRARISGLGTAPGVFPLASPLPPPPTAVAPIVKRRRHVASAASFAYRRP